LSERSISVVRNYALPKSTNKTNLVIALSYSGDTEETIATVKDALKRGCPIIAVTSGGKLAEISLKEKFPAVIIPGGLPPRSALGYLLGALLGITQQVLGLSEIVDAMKETVNELGKVKLENQREVPLRTNPTKKLASKIADKIPVIFGSDNLNGSAGYRWKCQLNENSKMTALSVNFPELNHNEIVNYSVLKRGEHNFCMVLFRDDKDSERNKKRIEITKSLIGIQLGGVNEIASRGTSKLCRLLTLIYFGDFVSVYAALARAIDPSPVDVITKLKKELNR
jgi:glucose/mannose-6-phosphate isomerase